MSDGPAPRPGPTVLIVDDSEDTARMMRLLLKRAGYAPIVAHDGPEAIAAAEAQRPSVVLLDLSLPTMSGQAVAEAIRARPHLDGVALVAVSGFPPDGPPAATPFAHHLIKPVDPDALLTILARLVAARDAP